MKILPSHFIFCLLPFSLVQTSLPAADKSFEGTDSPNWSEAANWRPSGVPDGDGAFIRNDHSAVISSSVPAVEKVIVGSATSGTTGKLIITEGGSLSVTSNVEIMRSENHTTRADGELEISGGSLTVEGRLKIGVGSSGQRSAAVGTASFSGRGSFHGALAVGSSIAEKGSGVINISGSQFVLDDGKNPKTLEILATARVNFQFDAAGVSVLNFSASSFQLSRLATVIIDGSQYRGPGGDIPLIVSDPMSMESRLDLPESTITGFSPSYGTPTISVNEGRMTLHLKPVAGNP